MPATAGAIIALAASALIADPRPAPLGVEMRLDTAPAPWIGPIPMRLRLAPDDFASDAAWLGLRGPVQSVTQRIDSDVGGGGEFQIGEESRIWFDQSGNATRIEQGERNARQPQDSAISEIRNAYQERAGEQVRRTARSTSGADDPSPLGVYTCDDHARLTRIEWRPKPDLWIDIRYSAVGDVLRIARIDEQARGEVWGYGPGGGIESWSRIQPDGRKNPDGQLSPLLRFIWTDDQFVTAVATEENVGRDGAFEAMLDEHGSIIRWTGKFFGPDTILIEREITRDDHGNWLSITESMSVPDDPSQPKRVWRRAYQRLVYRNELLSEPVEPKSKP